MDMYRCECRGPHKPSHRMPDHRKPYLEVIKSTMFYPKILDLKLFGVTNEIYRFCPLEGMNVFCMLLKEGTQVSALPKGWIVSETISCLQYPFPASYTMIFCFSWTNGCWGRQNSKITYKILKTAVHTLYNPLPWMWQDLWKRWNFTPMVKLHYMAKLQGFYNNLHWLGNRFFPSSLQMRTQPGQHLDFSLIRYWAEDPAQSCQDSWSTETMS